MKNFLSLISLLTACAATTAPCQAIELKPLSMDYPNGIAAVVNDHVITMDDLNRSIAPLIQEFARKSLTNEEFEDKINTYAHEILEEKINNQLLIKEFREVKKGHIPQAILHNNHEKMLEERFGGDRKQYLEFLKFKGKSDRDYRKEEEEEIILSFVNSDFRKSVAEISPDKIKRFYEEHKHQFATEEALHLRQIMMKPGENETAEELSQKVLQELESGKSFTEVAAKFSQDGMGSSGGDWGWISRKDIRPELSDVAFKLKKNTHSDPILLDDHIFIVFAQDKRAAGFEPLDKVRNKISDILVAQESELYKTFYIEKLRKHAHIKYYF